MTTWLKGGYVSRKEKMKSNSKEMPDSNGDNVKRTIKDTRTTPVKPVDSKLTPADIDKFKMSLLAKRQQLVGDVDNMAEDALKKSRTDAAGDLSCMPIHMADIGSDYYEQEFTLGLIQNEQNLLKEIDEALQRIEKGI
jgi:RNA polymerase-binding transcription factor DksA